MMETRSERKTVLYGVHFKGLFGRNRSVKFTASRKLVERPESAIEEKVWAVDVAYDFLATLKVMHGAVSVVAYDEGEVCTYTDDQTGRVIETQTYQPFSARTVIHNVINPAQK
jgi:hypothetical protein